MSYDVIGDVHGHAEELEALLAHLGYRDIKGAWRHSDREAVFVGDFIDRGPSQLETVDLVRRMVEAGTAQAVMGNHEFNAIAWYLKHPRSARRHLRPHTGRVGAKNRRQHQRFLQAVKARPGQHAELIDWFLTLPLWLERGGIRVVHACWHPRFMAYLQPQLACGNRLTRDLMEPATREPRLESLKDTPEPTVFKAVEALTKGLEIPLPTPHSFRDKDGHVRTRVRHPWWKREATSYGDIMLPGQAPDARLPDRPLPDHVQIADDGPTPTFVGHYWLTGTPTPLSNRVACVDYSVAKGGKLVAYRWDGESTLSAAKFEWVGK